MHIRTHDLAGLRVPLSLVDSGEATVFLGFADQVLNCLVNCLVLIIRVQRRMKLNLTCEVFDEGIVL